MSVDTFKPEVWSAALLMALRKALVFGGVVNRDYEGEISEFGDTVTINSVSRPTVSTYTPNSTSITPETLTTAQRKLAIDQAKYFAFEVDDVDARQVRGDLIPAAMSEAAFALADVGDAFLAALHSGVQAANALGTVAVPAATPTAAYDNVLVPLKVKLDEANVPSEDRWVVIPPWLHGRLLRDDRFIRADASGDDVAASIRGFVGRAAGFVVLVSNNTPFPGGDDNVVISGYRGAISFAQQINKVEAYRPESSFSDAVKGLHLYGGKLVRPDGIATAQASQT
ncbi:MAG: P22 coat protein - protein 5 domain protein [Gaiellaceae bacterium]